MALYDRTVNPISRQGAMDASAQYDIVAKTGVQRANAKAPSVYDNAQNDDNYSIVERELCFTVRKKRGDDGATVLRVLSGLNGFGADATRQYQSDPEVLEIVQEVVSNQIQFIGVSTAAINARDRGDVSRGVTVSFAGLTTVAAGNTGARKLRPGDVVEAVVPLGGDIGTRPASGAIPDPQIPRTKFRLQVRPLDCIAPARSLQLHIRKILENPQKWRIAMGDHHNGTNAWMSACRHVVTSYTFASLLALREMLAAGIVTAGSIANTLSGADQTEYENASAGRQADILVVHLAEYLRCIPARQRSLRLSAADKQQYGQLRLDIANRIFHGPSAASNRVNVAYELGYEPPTAANAFGTHHARYDNRGAVKQGDPEGDALTLQMNHLPQAAGGFSYAVYNSRRNIIGKAVTGETSNVHIAQGVHA